MTGLPEPRPRRDSEGQEYTSPAEALCLVDAFHDPEIVRRAATGEPLAVGIVGSGRAASALARSLRQGGVEGSVMVARRGESAGRLARELDAEEVDIAEVLGRADLTLLAVPDDAIVPLAVELVESAPPGDGRVVAHLSGSLESGILAPLACHGYVVGALHPLQVLTGQRIPPGTTFAVEGQEAALPVLARLIADLKGVELVLPEGTRGVYHAAATMTANLGMALMAEALDLMEVAGIERAAALDGLLSLVRGGLEASAVRGLPAALTGPVSRGDVETVRRHLALLGRDPQLLQAYRAVSVLALRQARRDGRPADPEAGRRMSELLGVDAPEEKNP